MSASSQSQHDQPGGLDLSLLLPSNLLYTQESIPKYRTGGYHPVTLGDTFKNERYKVYHKLGWGGYSTVWLVKDTQLDRWASLKILTADAPVSRELQNLKLLQSQGGLGSNFLVELLDEFTHIGPNGVHQCLVFELLGPSVHIVLADYKTDQEKPEPEFVFRFSTQLLKAVKFLHSVGMCHGAQATEEELFEVLGSPEVEPLARIDGTPLGSGLPTELVKAADWVDWVDEDEEDIRLLDFGESFLHGQEPAKLAQPGSLRVPETIFTDSFDYRVDLWRAGSMVYSFIFASWPFWYLGEDEVLIFQMIGFLGSLPTEWESQWESMLDNSSHDLRQYEGEHV
ncbi:hypothetical protein N7452_007088 [Penicillium brevicompactum]|uniref:non-specific serine/threonine protein kinase n=1 Tax=Penicillium brevicompactum TaxID=5074 RepID=A0A9W9QEQ0_PENBR|nr:hypothetical protein N7452_007088 [Penicillium brevicompactum]